MAKKQEKVNPADDVICAGCGAAAPEFPWVGIMHRDDAENDDSVIIETADNPDFVGVAVCDACHRDPAHRTYPLKCHFQPRAVGRVGVLMAGSTDVGM